MHQLEAAKGGSRDWERAHLLFHYALGRAGHSELLAYYHHQVMEEMTVFFGGFPPRYADRPTGVRLHTETLEALRTRDTERLARAMAVHLEDLERVAESLDEGDAHGRTRAASG